MVDFDSNFDFIIVDLNTIVDSFIHINTVVCTEQQT